MAFSIRLPFYFEGLRSVCKVWSTSASAGTSRRPNSSIEACTHYWYLSVCSSCSSWSWRRRPVSYRAGLASRLSLKNPPIILPMSVIYSRYSLSLNLKSSLKTRCSSRKIVIRVSALERVCRVRLRTLLKDGLRANLLLSCMILQTSDFGWIAASTSITTFKMVTASLRAS